MPGYNAGTLWRLALGGNDFESQMTVPGKLRAKACGGNDCVCQITVLGHSWLYLEASDYVCQMTVPGDSLL